MPTPISVRPPRPIVTTPADIADIAEHVHRLRAPSEVETQLLLNRVMRAARLPTGGPLHQVFPAPDLPPSLRARVCALAFGLARSFDTTTSTR